MNKTIRVALKNCNEIEKKKFIKILKDIRYATCKACNKAMTMYYIWENKKIEYKKDTDKTLSEKEIYGKTYRNVVEREMKKIMDFANTANVGQTNQFVMKKWNTDKKDVFKLKKSIANFKLSIPIFLKNSSYKVSKGNSGYEITCSLFNRNYQKENEIKSLTLTVDKLDGNKKATLNKIISGVYKQGSMQIVEDNKDKWYMNISFSFESKQKELNTNRILGVDLGITNVATLQIWDNETEDWERLSWKKCVLDGKELIHYRQKIYKRRIDLLRNSKISETSKGKAGHGRNKRIQSIEVMSEKVKNFRNTLNHKYSRYIIEFALKNNCGVIQMEDLSGFSEHQKEKFLQNWSYYDLQDKVKYKAKEHEIDVVLINPRYTSKRCSSCGCIHEYNRDCKNNQAKFECVVCNHKENADINASKNIAIPYIDKIIEEQLKTK